MGESNMRKKIFKKMLALAITASMLSGNLVTAFAQETKEVFEFATVAGEELGGLGSTEEYGYTGEFDTEESTTEESGDTGEISTEEISSQEPETSVELPPEYAHLNQWIVLTDWDDESFVQFMDAVREWSDEELEQYKIAVTKESKETLAAYTSQLKLEKWEEFFGEFDSEHPFIQNVNVVTLFPEINFGTGEWKEEENGLSYIKEDGTKAIGWYEMVDDIWYYFDEDGYRTTGWRKEKGTWYYFNYAGVMVQDRFAYVDGTIYCFSGSGAMLTGWNKIDGRWYYFRPSGALVKLTWEKIDGKWYYLWHDGSMATGWLEKSGSWYYLGTDGAMKTGWQKVDGTWYYLTGSGAMKTGWMFDGANWFYLNSSGAMKTGWLELGTNWFYFYENGVMATNTYIGEWYVDANGYYVSGYMTDAQILGKIEYLKTKYPEGKYWNHVGISTTGDTSEIITNTPCYHGAFSSYSTCNRYDIFNADIEGYSWIKGYQCAGFAFKLSDEIFGTDADRIYYNYNFDSIRVGDTIRIGEYFGNYGHSVVVIGKSKNYITVAECNAGNTCKINWGRKISRSELNSEYKVTCETRRP